MHELAALAPSLPDVIILVRGGHREAADRLLLEIPAPQFT